jgi:GAF domain-containing protein
MSAEVPVLTDDAESLRARLDMLRDACSGALSVDELVVIAVAQAKAATRAAGGVLFVLEGDELTVAAGAGYPAELLAQWSRFPVSDATPAGNAARTGRAQWHSHPLEKARRYPELSPERTGYGALAALPVRSGPSMLGVLGISFRGIREFTPVERLFLLLLADQVGVALDRVRGVGHSGEVLDHVLVADPVRRQVVGEVFAVMETARATIDRSTALARSICDAGSAQFSLIETDQVVAGASGAAPGIGSVSPADESLCTVTMSLRAPLNVADALADDRLTPFPPVRSGEVRAYLGAPVSVCGELVGAFCVYDGRPRAWSEQQLELITSLASTLGTELTLRCLVARDARILQTAETHLVTLDRLAAAETIGQAAGVLLEAVTEMHGVSGAAVIVTDEQTGLRCQRAQCLDPEAATALGILAGQGSAPVTVTANSLELADLIAVLHGDAAFLVEQGTRRAIQVLIPGRATLGSLVVALAEHADTDQVRWKLVDLARIAGASLDRVASYERHQLATSRTAFLTAASAHMEASLDIDETLQRMARVAVPALAVGCLVYLVDLNGLRLAAASHLDVRVEKRLRPELGSDPVFVRLVESTLAEPRGTPDELPDWLRAERLRSAPLWARGNLIGVIVLLETAADGRPRLADDILMTDLANHAAITIDNAIRYTKRTAAVSALQYQLLPPRLPVLPEFDLAAFYEAGDRSLDVGGDFYDVIATAEDRLVLLIGDVCGRGAKAAAVTGVARTVLRTVVQDGASPARALERLNDAMRAAGDRGEFCTAVVAQVDGRGDTCHVRIAVGGHPLPLLRRAGVTREIGRHGPMLGLLAAPIFGESEIPLFCDDLMLLYTDGITEARQGDEFFGPRLAAALTEADRSAEKTITHALLAVEQFRDASNDDIAMLALRPRGRSVARIELADLRDPSCRTSVFALLSQTLPAGEPARRLARRVGVALSRVQLSSPGPADVEVLRAPAGWRVEISRPAPHDRPSSGSGEMTRPDEAVPGNIHHVRHGLQILETVEVTARHE